MNRTLHIAIFTMILAQLLSACAPVVVAGGGFSSPTPAPQMATTQAQVQSVEIQVTGTNPSQLNVLVRGQLPDACTHLGQSEIRRAGNTFQVTVYEVSPTDHGCVQVLSPFETTIPLDTTDLAPGTYAVNADGASAVFTLPGADPVPTIVPTVAATERPAPVSTSQGCSDSAAFVRDVSILDGSAMAPGTTFTKTWRLKNTGSCTWDSGYLVSYISGTTMTQQPGYWIVHQGQTVPPGQTVDISVGMTAPVASGNYGSYWGLKKENGQLMPVQGGANGNSFYVKIRVDGGQGTGGSITAASIDIQLEQGSGAACTPGATYFVHSSITADGPTTASYEIESSAGQIAAGYFQVSPTGPISPVENGTVTFEQAGIQTINLRFVGPYPYPDNITVMMRVNGGEWHSATVLCG